MHLKNPKPPDLFASSLRRYLRKVSWLEAFLDTDNSSKPDFVTIYALYVCHVCRANPRFFLAIHTSLQCSTGSHDF